MAKTIQRMTFPNGGTASIEGDSSYITPDVKFSDERGMPIDPFEHNQEIEPIKPKDNLEEFFPSRKIDPTLGGRINPYEYIDDWEAKVMFNATKQDVDIARSGGAKIGSLSQKILGNSGAILDNGQYIADPKLANTRDSLVNAIRHYGFSPVYNEIIGDVVTDTMRSMKGFPDGGSSIPGEIASGLHQARHYFDKLGNEGIEALRQAQKQEIKERQIIDECIQLKKMTPDKIKTLILLSRKGGLNTASTNDELVAVKIFNMLKDRAKEEATDPQILGMQYESNIMKLEKDFPYEHLSVLNLDKVPELQTVATIKDYFPALQAISRRIIKTKLENDFILRPELRENNINLMKIVDGFDSPYTTSQRMNIEKTRPEETAGKFGVGDIIKEGINFYLPSQKLNTVSFKTKPVETITKNINGIDVILKKNPQNGRWEG